MSNRQTGKPTLDPESIVNPRYAGATPEMVGLALLRHKPDQQDQDEEEAAPSPD